MAPPFFQLKSSQSKLECQLPSLSPLEVLAPFRESQRETLSRIRCLSPSLIENAPPGALEGNIKFAAMQISRMALSDERSFQEATARFFGHIERDSRASILERVSIAHVQNTLEELREVLKKNLTLPECRALIERAEEVIKKLPIEILHRLLAVHFEEFKKQEDEFYQNQFPKIEPEIMPLLESASLRKVLPIDTERVVTTLSTVGVQVVDDFMAYPNDGNASPLAHCIQLRANAISTPLFKHIFVHESVHLLGGIALYPQEEGPDKLPLTSKQGLRFYSPLRKESLAWLDEAVTEILTARILEISPQAYKRECAILQSLCYRGPSGLNLRQIMRAYFEHGRGEFLPEVVAMRDAAERYFPFSHKSKGRNLFEIIEEALEKSESSAEEILGSLKT